MISIIGAIIGFLSSFAPMVADLIKARMVKNQEIAMMQLQITAAANGANVNFQSLQTSNYAEQLRMAYSQEATPTGIMWVEGMRALVRPGITYVFFTLFLMVKAFGMYRLIDMGVPFVDTVAVIWDEDTAAMFALVISFWFGNRTVERIK